MLRRNNTVPPTSQRSRLGGVLLAAAVVGAGLVAAPTAAAAAPGPAPAAGPAAGMAGTGAALTDRPALTDPTARHRAFRAAGALDGPVRLAQGVAARPRAAAALPHTVTIRGVDLDGTPTAPDAELISLADGTAAPLTWTGTALTATVAPGGYTLTAAIITGPDPFNPTDVTLYSEPTLTVASDLTVTVDARAGQPVRAQVPAGAAAKVMDRAAVVQRVAGQVLTSYANGDTDTTLRALPSASRTTREYAFLYMAVHAEPASQPAPRSYYVGFPTPGRVPAALTFTATPGELAEVRARYLSQGVPPTGYGNRNELIAFDAAPYAGVFGLERPVAVPGSATEYFTATAVRWRGNLFTPVGAGALYEEQTALRRFAAGGSATESWNSPAFGPSVQVGHGASSLVAFVNPAQTGQPDRDALPDPAGTSSTLRLYRNNTLVGQRTQPLYGEFAVPASAADYRLELSTARTPVVSRYATRTTARWSWRSSGTGDPLDHLRTLPHLRATGAFDLSGRAPAGTAFGVRVSAQPAGSRITAVTLHATYNDGATWVPVSLTPTAADTWQASVAHPRSGHNGYVGLRYTATDAGGAALTHTTLRAYGLS